MEDKKQDVNSLEELLKVVNAYSGWFSNLADELSKVLADIQTSKKEKNTWEMKCPYEEDEEVWIIDEFGEVDVFKWGGFAWKNDCLRQGNTFPTKQSAELEAKRRNLLTQFRAFRDECNNGWKPDWNDHNSTKWSIYKDEEGLFCTAAIGLNNFATFGYFKNKADCERAIELFNDEIQELLVECD